MLLFWRLYEFNVYPFLQIISMLLNAKGQMYTSYSNLHKIPFFQSKKTGSSRCLINTHLVCYKKRFESEDSHSPTYIHTQSVIKLRFDLSRAKFLSYFDDWNEVTFMLPCCRQEKYRSKVSEFEYLFPFFVLSSSNNKTFYSIPCI